MILNSPKSNSLKPKEEGKKNNNQKRFYHNKKKKPLEKQDKKEVKTSLPDISSPTKSFKKNKIAPKKAVSSKVLDKNPPNKKEKELIPSFGKKKNLKVQKKREPIPPFERRKISLSLLCSYCNKKIQDPFSAIASPESSQEVYHFDCAIDQIKKNYPLGEGESIIYIGGGYFALAKVRRVTKLKTDFEIIQRIEFEPKKEDYLQLNWRKELQQK